MKQTASTIALLLLLFAIATTAVHAASTPPTPATTVRPHLQLHATQQPTAPTWEPLALPSAVTPETLRTLQVHPFDAALLYLATDSGLYHSADAGTSWRRFDTLGERPIFDVTQAEADPQRLYVRSWQSYRSDDGGATWREITMPDEVCGLMVAPSAADQLYARHCGPTPLPPVFRSEDGGATWIVPATPLTITFEALAVAPNQPDLLIASNYDTSWRSIDRGVTWQQMAIGERFYGKPIFDRQTPPQLYLGHWMGLLRSQDGGLTWEDSDAAREMTVLAPLAAPAGALVGGNRSAQWRFTVDTAQWQATAWPTPDNVEALWSSTHDPGILYLRTGSGLWRFDQRPARIQAENAIYLPLIHAQSATPAVGNAVTVAPTSAPIRSANRNTTPAEQAIAQANTYRALAGMLPLVPHPALATAAQNHADYTMANYADSSAWLYGAHGEVAAKPYFTGQWPKDRISISEFPWGGGAEIIHGLGDPVASVDGWMATVYHRFPLLEPYNHYVGYGYHAGAPMEVDVMDFGAGPLPNGIWLPAAPHPLAYPADGQTGVPTSWNGAEIPNPLPDGVAGPVGYPFTLQAIGGKMTINEAALYTADGTLVATHPNPPDCAAGRCLALMAAAPLLANTTYVVKAAGDVSGVTFNSEWRFTTGGEATVVTAAMKPIDLSLLDQRPYPTAEQP
jgi:uncharacterized protein YkwD